MKLYIGNKNYSSWSLRVWLTLRMHNIEFEEILRPFDVENDFADYFEFSPSGKVPALEDGTLRVWESLAILEYVAERFPDRPLWPDDLPARTYGRSIAHEIHGGFGALRAACPMNMRRRIETVPIDATVRKDIARIESIWTEALSIHGGPFLLGDTFSIADGMYAPVVNRLQVYALSDSDVVARYIETVSSTSLWREWADAARAESWVVEIDEVYA
ncbi:MAG: glutathione S-transferase family protein [Myxococcota bacterium]